MRQRADSPRLFSSHRCCTGSLRLITALSVGFKQACSQGEMATPGQLGKAQVSNPLPQAQVPRQNCFCSLPHPLWEGQTVRMTRQLMEQRLKHSLGKSHPKPFPTDLSKIHLALFWAPQVMKVSFQGSFGWGIPNVGFRILDFHQSARVELQGYFSLIFRHWHKTCWFV